MIKVHTWLDESLLWIDVTGHASQDVDAPLETHQVCSGVSTLLVGLWDFVKTGKWDGEGSGHVRVSAHVINDCERHSYKFVLHALKLIADNYPGHITFEDGEPCPSTLPDPMKKPES